MTHPPSQQDDPTSVLFHQQVSVAVLGSGSKGNATYVGDGRCGLLIDCGLSTKQIFKRMEAIGLSGAPLDAVLITHEHSDHVAAAGVLDRTVTRRTGGTIPFFMTRGTAANVNPKCRPTLVQTITAGRAFPWRGWRIEPYTIPHDTRDPVAYTLTIGKLRIGVVTDLGRATTETC